jgi:hypothetical protein
LSDARDQVGGSVGVSGKSIDFATKALNHGVPEVVRAVDRGKVTVNAAVRAVHSPVAHRW